MFSICLHWWPASAMSEGSSPGSSSRTKTWRQTRNRGSRVGQKYDLGPCLNIVTMEVNMVPWMKLNRLFIDYCRSLATPNIQLLQYGLLISKYTYHSCSYWKLMLGFPSKVSLLGIQPRLVLATTRSISGLVAYRVHWLVAFGNWGKTKGKAPVNII